MTPPQQHPSAALSFRTWLADLDQTQLATLLAHRSDVLNPLPPAIAPLATRLTLRTSLALALSHCDAALLAAAEDIAERGGELEEVAVTKPAATSQLLERGLAFTISEDATNPDTVVLAPGLMQALPTEWSLLHQSTTAPEEIAALPEDEARILHTLVTSGGVGTTRDAAPDADPARPIPRLLAKGILTRVDSRTVRLPRAARRALEGHTPELIPLEPSGRAGTPNPNSKANDAGTAAGLQVVRELEQLIDVLGAHPIELLKDKTVGVRPQANLAKELSVTETELRRLVCLGFAARLLSRGEPKGLEGNFLAPTQGAQEWLDATLADKWSVLIDAWQHSTWQPWEEGRLLDPESSKDRLPRHRATVMDIYAHSAMPLSKKEFWEDLRFRFPLFATHTKSVTIDALVDEAEWLGLIALGQATQALLDPAATHSLTPDTVDYFIIQGDLTVLAPGPLEAASHHRLSELADLESPGLASLYRITESTLRRGLDVGMTAEDITAFFATHSEVPQALEFLIKDVSRRHGTLRSGPALAYLRSEDPALLEMAVRVVPELCLIAPTVAISQLRVGPLLEKLREHGMAPAAEDENGASLSMALEPYALPTPAARKAAKPSADPVSVAAALLASGETTPAAADESSLDILHAAARSGRQVTIVYADKNGNSKNRTVKPLSVAGGQVDAAGSDGSMIRFPLHRITSVRLV